jgi:hypothetical protein
MMREYPFSTLGYAQPTYGVGSPDELSGIPDEYLNVVAAKLALRICPMMGATCRPEAKGNLASSMALLNAAAATIPTMPIAAKRHAEPARDGASARSSSKQRMMSDAPAPAQRHDG